MKLPDLLTTEGRRRIHEARVLLAETMKQQERTRSTKKTGKKNRLPILDIFKKLKSSSV